MSTHSTGEKSKSTGHSKFHILSDESSGLTGDSTLQQLMNANQGKISTVLKAFFKYFEYSETSTLKEILLFFRRVNFKKFSQDYDIPVIDTENLKEELEEIVNPEDIAKLLDKMVLMDDHVKDEVFGRSLNIDSAYNDRCTQIYAKYGLPDEGKRKNVSLVMGASGSGKSFFAAKSFTKKLFDGAKDTPAYYVTVFMTYGAICDDEQNEGTIKNKVLKYVKNCFTKKLGSRYDATKPVKNLFLCVVIDEVVGERCGFFMRDDLEFPKQIATDLKEKVASSEVHVVLAGTGLEKLSQGIDTNVPFSKIRMRDWDIDTFRDFCKSELKPNPAEIVERHPVLLSLVSNARCAYYLRQAVKEMRIWDETNNNMGFINAVLQYVAAKYKTQNGLKNFVKETDLQLIAKGVLTVLKEAAVMKEENNDKNEEDQTWDFIEYDRTIPEKHRSACDGFLDVNLEKTGKNVGLADAEKEYPVGISSALTYLLAVFMGDSGHVGADPQRFEYLTALGEAQMKLIKLEKNELELLPIKIIPSPVQCPGTKDNKFNFLNTSSSNVVINAGQANSADVYCMRGDNQLRVVQAKFSIHEEEVTLYILDELKKNGMLKSSTNKHKHFLTHLYQNWTTNGFENTTASSEKKSTDTEGNKEIRRSTYPVSKMVVYPKNKLHGLYETQEIDVEENATFKDGRMNITAVFSTNAGRFIISKKKRDTVHITKDDVDINGQLIQGKREQLQEFVKQKENDLPNDLRKDLNLEFEFSFYTCK